LPFLELNDFTRLMRCNRRFEAVSRKGRNVGMHGMHVKGDAAVVRLLLSSMFSQYVGSLHLERPSPSDAPLTRDILHELRHLPRLTSLQLVLSCSDDVDHLMRGLLPDNAAAEIRAVLPLQLRSFSMAVVGRIDLGDQHASVLHSSIWAAVEEMTQLTELSIVEHSLYRIVHRSSFGRRSLCNHEHISSLEGSHERICLLDGGMLMSASSSTRRFGCVKDAKGFSSPPRIHQPLSFK